VTGFAKVSAPQSGHNECPVASDDPVTPMQHPVSLIDACLDEADDDRLRCGASAPPLMVALHGLEPQAVKRPPIGRFCLEF
jgi:hypothetical protein